MLLIAMEFNSKGTIVIKSTENEYVKYNYACEDKQTGFGSVMYNHSCNLTEIK